MWCCTCCGENLRHSRPRPHFQSGGERMRRGPGIIHHAKKHQIDVRHQRPRKKGKDIRTPAAVAIFYGRSQISKKHCSIQWNATELSYTICDTSSTGTWVAAQYSDARSNDEQEWLPVEVGLPITPTTQQNVCSMSVHACAGSCCSSGGVLHTMWRCQRTACGRSAELSIAGRQEATLTFCTRYLASTATTAPNAVTVYPAITCTRRG